MRTICYLLNHGCEVFGSVVGVAKWMILDPFSTEERLVSLLISNPIKVLRDEVIKFIALSIDMFIHGLAAFSPRGILGK